LCWINFHQTAIYSIIGVFKIAEKYFEFWEFARSNKLHNDYERDVRKSYQILLVWENMFFALASVST